MAAEYYKNPHMSYDDICRMNDELRLVLVFQQFAIRNCAANCDVSPKATCQYAWNLSSAAAAGVWDVAPCSLVEIHEI